MSVLPIRQIGDPVLRTPSSPVGEIDARIRKLVEDMYETNAEAGGIGIAAPQVGVSLRIFTWDVRGNRGAVINPQLELSGEPVFTPREPDSAQSDEEYSEYSADTAPSGNLVKEGCLSVQVQTPEGGIFGPVTRYPQAVLTGLTPEGEQLRVQGQGLLSACFQHELDHLDGKLFLDRLEGEHRKAAFRRLREAG